MTKIQPLKIFVGCDGRFVLCEKFPRDEFHDPLHEALEFMIDDDPYVNEDEIGFYMAEFYTENGGDSHPEYTDHDWCLVFGKLTKIESGDK